MGKKKKKKVVFPTLSAGANLIDTHCHLDMDDYGDELPDILDRAASMEVGRVISVAIDMASSRAAVAIAGREAGVAATVGVHPHYVDGFSDRELAELAALAESPRVVAIGEIGMDMVKSRVAPESQARAFSLQLDLARELDLPVVIHDREAHDRVFAILEESAPLGAGGVMHCFSGDEKLAHRAIELGFYISIPGVVTFPKAEVIREVVGKVPLSRMLVETDGPYLSPVPLRGRRNEPLHVLFTAAMIAEIKGIALDEVAMATTANAVRLFRMEGIDERG